VRVDEDTITVEQEPVDSHSRGVAPSHEKAGYVKMARG
jgi:hypothetical protein